MKIDTHVLDDKLCLVLPAESVAESGWQHGDELEGKFEDGTLTVVRSKTKHERAMEIARGGMDRYRSALESLSKT